MFRGQVHVRSGAGVSVRHGLSDSDRLNHAMKSIYPSYAVMLCLLTIDFTCSRTEEFVSLCSFNLRCRKVSELNNLVKSFSS